MIGGEGDGIGARTYTCVRVEDEGLCGLGDGAAHDRLDNARHFDGMLALYFDLIRC